MFNRGGLLYYREFLFFLLNTSCTADVKKELNSRFNLDGNDSKLRCILWPKFICETEICIRTEVAIYVTYFVLLYCTRNRELGQNSVLRIADVSGSNLQKGQKEFWKLKALFDVAQTALFSLIFLTTFYGSLLQLYYYGRRHWPSPSSY